MRLVTTANLDGVVSAALIMRYENVSELIFTHPRMIQDGTFKLKAGDAVANLPHKPGIDLWFDHHPTELWYDYHPSGASWFDTPLTTVKPIRMPEGVRGKMGISPSAAHLVYEYYGSPDEPFLKDLIEQTDRFDSGNLSFEDVLMPKGWIFLGFSLDPRTGLGTDNKYSERIIQAINKSMSIEQIMQLPDVTERMERYIEGEKRYKKALIQYTDEDNNLSVTDFRMLNEVPVGNRFLVYTFFPRCNINIRVFRDNGSDDMIIAVGKSIFDRSHPTNLGNLLAEYGGGGLQGAGTCKTTLEESEKIVEELISRLRIS